MSADNEFALYRSPIWATSKCLSTGDVRPTLVLTRMMEIKFLVREKKAILKLELPGRGGGTPPEQKVEFGNLENQKSALFYISDIEGLAKEKEGLVRTNV